MKHCSIDELDVYPEYTGTGLLVVLGATIDDCHRRGELDGSAPAAEASPVADHPRLFMPFARSVRIAVRSGMARSNPDEQFPGAGGPSDRLPMSTASTPNSAIDTPSHLIPIWSLRACRFRRAGGRLLGLQQVYGEFDATVNGVAPGIKYQALMDGDANVVLAFSTDAEIAINDLVVLTDDKELWPLV